MNRLRTFVAGVMGSVSLTWIGVASVSPMAGIAMPSLASAQQTVSTADARGTPKEGTSPLLDRRVTVDLDHVTLSRALDVLAERSGVQIVHKEETVNAVSKAVTLHLVKATLGSALERVLEGTGLRVVELPETGLGIVRGTSEVAAQNGGIRGTVVDSATRTPLAGAVVSVDGAKTSIRTDDHGVFMVPGLAPGLHHLTVHRLGYHVSSTDIRVHDDGSVMMVTIALNAANTLQEVVTTANGQQRRVEVGNVVAHLNVDSIARTAPVANVTDLLSARVPGVQVIQSSGMVGSGVSIRIRGQGSPGIPSDPIIIVDGVRQDNSPGGNAPSRLNDINVSQIQSIDVLKGPAASTEYGTDAANGVIVITTKKGSAGPPQWRVTGEHGWSSVPTNFPDFYYMWGHAPDDPSKTPIHCTFVTVATFYPSVAAGDCVEDSVVHDNPLNHANTTIYGTGPSQSGDISVSGGTGSVLYFLGANSSTQDGTVRLPEAFKPLATALGFPSTVFNPNTQTQQSVRTTLNAHLGETGEVDVTGSIMSTRVLAPGASSGGLTHTSQSGPVVLDSAHAFGYGAVSTSPYGSPYSTSPLATLGTMLTQRNTRATGGVTGTWHPLAWFTGRATVGADYGTFQESSITSASAVQVMNNGVSTGSETLTNGTNDITSTDFNGTFAGSIRPDLRATTSLGLQTVLTKSQSLTAGASGLNQNPSLNGALNPNAGQSADGNSTVGGYAEEQFAYRDRLFFTAALRLDGASGFGGDYNTTLYPKANVSWVAFNHNGTNLRLRGAFGAAGVQPKNGTALQLYTQGVSYINGQSIPSVTLEGPGNPNLRPERSQEYEGGFDLGLLDDRMTLEFTGYSKWTHDAIVATPLGLTFGDGSDYQQNIGVVRNTGVEVTVSASLLRTASTTWDVTVNAAANRNKLVTLAPNVIQQLLGGEYYDYSNQANRAGYPLNGYWAPRVTFADTSHLVNGVITSGADGIIEYNEVSVEDTTSYMGSSIPKMEGSVSSQVGLFRGLITIGGLFDYRTGDVIFNQAAFQAISTRTAAGVNDPNASLFVQAQGTSYGYEFQNGNGLTASSSLFYENGWFVRWRELSTTFNAPVRWAHRFHTQSLSVTAAVRNLALWTHYTGADPEVSGRANTDSNFSNNGDFRADNGGGTPLPRTWVLRFNLGL